MMQLIPVSFRVNGEDQRVEVKVTERLVDTLRDRLRLTGVKEGCGIGECGACTVLINGEAVNSCLILTLQVEGSQVVTIEGLEKEGVLDPLQESFIDHQAVQCGFCTPGMILSAKALLLKHPHPTREQIKEALDGNLCRCTGYAQILAAIEGVNRGEGS